MVDVISRPDSLAALRADKGEVTVTCLHHVVSTQTTTTTRPPAFRQTEDADFGYVETNRYAGDGMRTHTLSLSLSLSLSLTHTHTHTHLAASM